LRFRRGLLFLLFVLLVAFGVSALAQSGGSLHGSVIQLSGTPVVQASITVEGSGGGQAATTNGEGKYGIKGLEPGTYSVKITAPGFESFEVTVSVQSGDNREVDAVLMVAPPAPEPVQMAARRALDFCDPSADIRNDPAICNGNE